MYLWNAKVILHNDILENCISLLWNIVFLHHKRATGTKHFDGECTYVDEQESFVINFHPLELAL